MAVDGFVLPDAVVRSLMHSAPVPCQPFSRNWLDRTLMSADRDRRLHREGRCPFIQLAGGRWEIDTEDPDYPLTVTDSDRLSPPVRGVLHKAAERRAQLAPGIIRELSYRPTAVVRPRGGPWYAYDGNWILSLRYWVAVLSVTGQPQCDDPLSPDGPTTISKRRAPAPLYPPPAEPDHARIVARYLGVGNPASEERWRSRLLPLAYYFAELITHVPGGRPKEIRQVAIDLCLESPQRVPTICTALYRKIWGPRVPVPGNGRANVQLFRYLMDNDMLRYQDVVVARAIAEENHRSGASVRAAELFGRGRRSR
jgi:hypothetical protein